MLAKEYGWTLPEIFNLTIYQVYKLTQSIKYRKTQEHKTRIIEHRTARVATKNALMSYLQSLSQSAKTNNMIISEGFGRRKKK